jgi:hypothetical protein
LWPSTLFLDDDTEQQHDFTEFRISMEKQNVAELMNYTKGLSCPEAQPLDEEAVEECLNNDNDTPVVLQLTRQ